MESWRYSYKVPLDSIFFVLDLLSFTVGRKCTNIFYGNYKGFLSKKSFERLFRGTLSGDEIGRFLCFGGKMSCENKDERMQRIHGFFKGHLPRIVHCLGK